MNAFKRILSMAIVAVAMAGVSVNATNIYTLNADGDWENIMTWTSSPDGVDFEEVGVPTEADHVVIGQGRTITIHSAVTVASLENRGNLKIVGSGSLKVNGRLSGQGSIQTAQVNGYSAATDDFTQQSTIILTGSAVDGSAGQTFNNLTIAAGCIFHAGDNLSVNGTLTVNGIMGYRTNAKKVEVNNMVIASTGVFVGNTSKNVDLTLRGNLTNDGRVYLDGGRDGFSTQGVFLTLEGGNEQLLNFQNTGGNKAYIKRVTLSKDANTMATIQANNSANLIFSTDCDGGINSQPIVLTSGILQLGSGVNITRLGRGASTSGDANENEAFVIPSAAGLRIAGANVALGSSDNRYGLIYLEGQLGISSGTLSFTANTEGIVYKGLSASINIEGGTINTSGIRPSSFSGTSTPHAIRFNQSGGTLNLSLATGKGNSFAPFSIINDASVYEVSGGKMIFSTTNRGGNGSIGAQGFVVNVPEGNYSVTGGEIEISGGKTNEFEFRTNAPIYNLKADNAMLKFKQSWVQNGDYYVLKDIDLKNSTVAIENISVYIGRNLSVKNSSSITSNMNIVFNGNANSVIDDDSYSGKGTQFQNFIVEKGSKAATLTVQNNRARVAGDLTIRRGTVVGKIDMNGSGQQTITSEQGDLSNFDLLVSGSEVRTGSNLSIRQLSFGGSLSINIGSYNLRLAQAFSPDDKKAYVVTNGKGTDGGLTMPVGAGHIVYFPVGIGSGASNYLGAKVVSNGQVGMMTVAPNNGLHPAAPTYAGLASYTPLNYYWHIEWEGTTPYSANGFNYTFYHSQNNCTTDRIRYLGKYYYTNVYQYVSDDWKKVNGSLTKGTNANGTVTVTSFADNSFAGDFSTCNELAMEGNSFHGATTYFSTKSGNWNDHNTWVTDDPNSTTNRWGNDGTPNEHDVVVIQKGHTVTVKGDIGWLETDNKGAAAIEIKEGCKLVVNARDKSMSVSEISGDGTLVYKFDGNNNNFITADYTKFAASSKATMVFEVNGNIEWPSKTFVNAYPNLTIRPMNTSNDTDMLCVAGITSFTVNGNLKIEKNGNRKVHFSTKNLYVNDFEFVVNGDMTIDAGCQYSTTSQQNSKQYFYGNIVNNGTFTNNGASDSNILRNSKLYLYGNLQNNGVFDAKNYVDYFLTGEREQIINGTQPVKAYHVVLDKANATDKVFFQTPLVDRDNANNPVQLQLKNGYLVLDVNNRVWKAETYKTVQTTGEPNETLDNLFHIPASATVDVRNNGTLNLTKQTSNVALSLDGALLLKGAAKLTSNYGIVYGSSGVSELNIGASSEVTTKFLQPQDVTSSLKYTQQSSATVTVAGNQNDGKEWASVDIRGGRFQMVNSATITINNASNGKSLYFAPANQVSDAASKFVLKGIGTLYAEKELMAMNINGATTLASDVTYKGVLTLNSTFTANNYDVTLKANANLGNGSQYVPGTNTTYLTAGNQSVTSSGVVKFYRLVRNGSGDASLPAFEASNDVEVLSGNINLSVAATAKRNVVVSNGSFIKGEALTMNGATASGNPKLNCQGTINRLVVATDVDASKSDPTPITIAKNLALNDGNLIIGTNNLHLALGATVTTTGSFGSTKMISNAMAAMSQGVTMSVTNGSFSRQLPVGRTDDGAYMPVDLSFTATNTGSEASVTVKHIDVDHVVLMDPTDTEACKKPYWSVSLNNVTIGSGSLSCTVPTSAIGSLEGYSLGILPLGEMEWTVYTLGEDAAEYVRTEGANTIFTFPIVVSGDYAVAKKFPAVKSYISVGDGNAIGDAIWKSYNPRTGEIADDEPISLSLSEIAGKGLYIDNNVDITVNNLKPYAVHINPSGVLDVNNTLAHRFTIFTGTGKLRVRSGALPSSIEKDFYSAAGGTIEFYAEGARPASFGILAGYTTVNNVILNNVDVNLPKYMEKTLLNGSLTLTGGASFNIGSPLEMKGDLVIGSGCTLTSEDEGAITFVGNNNQSISSETSNYQFGVKLEVNKPAGHLAITNSMTFTKCLKLTKGIVKPDSNVLTISQTAKLEGGSVNSFVDGKLRMYVYTTGQKSFPVGDNNSLGTAYIKTQTNDYYTIRYVNNTPEHSDQLGDIAQLSNYEYWEIYSDNNSSAKIGLSWDENSVIDESNFTFAHYRDGAWNNLQVDTKSITGKTVGYGFTKDPLQCKSTGEHVSFASTAILPPVEILWLGSASTDWFNPDNWSTGEVPAPSKPLVKIGQGQPYSPVINTSDVLVVQTVQILDGATLTLDSSPMTVNENILTEGSGKFVIRHGVNKSASFVTKKYDIANVIVERELKTKQTYYVGSADESQRAILDPPAGTVISKRYNYQTEDYTTMTDGKLYTGTIGAAVSGASTWTLKQKATIKKLASKSTSITTITDLFWGWHMIVNHLPVSINLNNISRTGSNIDPVVWLRTEKEGQRVWMTYNISSHVAVNMPVESDDPSEPTITNGMSEVYVAPYQAFFMKVKNGAKGKPASGTVTVQAPAGDPHIGKGTSLKSTEQPEPDDVLRFLLMSDNAASDETALVFRDGSVSSVCDDADKKFETDKYNAIAVDKAGEYKAIASLPDVDMMFSTGTNLYVAAASGATSAKIVAYNIDLFDPTADVFLIDRANDLTIDLRADNTYIFEPSDADADRFAVVLYRSDYVEETVTGADPVDAGVELLSSKTYTVVGSAANTNSRGVTLVVETYSDGSQRVCKQLQD